MRVVDKTHPDAEGKSSSRMILAFKQFIVTDEEPEIYIENLSATWGPCGLEQNQ